MCAPLCEIQATVVNGLLPIGFIIASDGVMVDWLCLAAFGIYKCLVIQTH
jgi:hypothetical protein